jgi:hypothetical protein
MTIITILDYLPLWGLFFATVGLVLLSIELGRWLARYQRSKEKEINEAPIGPMTGAVLGLLAFMLAFTFGFAASRFEERKQMLLNEANVLRTAYLRAGLLPEPIPTESRAILEEYIDTRIVSGEDPTKIDEAISKSRELQGRLWKQAVAAADKGRPPINSLFVQSVNEIIDVHSKRVMAGLRNRVPALVWVVLYSLIVLAMSALGYLGGLAKPKRSPAGITLVLAFSCVITLIADLDRPGGLLNVSQEGMIELKQDVAAHRATQ